MKTQIKQINNSSITSQSSSVQQLYAKFENLKQRITNTDNTRRSSRSIQRKDVKQRDLHNNNVSSRYRKIGLIEPLPLGVYVGLRNGNQNNVIVQKRQQKMVSCSCQGNVWEEERRGIIDGVLTLIHRTQQAYKSMISQLSTKLLVIQSKLHRAQRVINQKITRDIQLQQHIRQLQTINKRLQQQKGYDQLQMCRLRQEVKYKVQQIHHVKQENDKLITQLEIYFNCTTNTAHNQTKHSKDTVSSQTIHITQQQCLGEQHKILQLNNSNSHNNSRQLQIQAVKTDRSDILDNIQQMRIQQQQSAQMLDIMEMDKSPYLSRSLMFNRPTIIRNNSQQLFSIKRKEKELMDEIHLLEQENRLLKNKVHLLNQLQKDKFQAEIFKAENDEDMMQQQLGRLNQQIRRLNIFWMGIDDCALKLFKGEELKQQKIALLEKESKLREEYYKKRESKKRGFSLRR